MLRDGSDLACRPPGGPPPPWHRVLSFRLAVPPRRPALRAVLLASVALLASPAPASADRARARALAEEAELLRAEGAVDAALDRLQQAIEADPDFLAAHDAATALWIQAGRFDRVVERLGRVTLRHPRHASSWYALAFAYRQTGRPDLAVLCYEAYIALRPHEPDPYFGLAMADLELGRLDQATRALERYLALEDRPERAEYLARARLELARLRRDREDAHSPLRRLAARLAALVAELASSLGAGASGSPP